MTRHYFIIIIIFVLSSAAPAFNGHTTTTDPLTITIAPIDNVTSFDAPQKVDVNLKNTAKYSIEVSLKIDGLIDQWYAHDAKQKTIVVPPNSNANTSFNIAVHKGALSALYPVHIYAEFTYKGKTTKAHCVQIFQSDFPNDPANTSPSSNIIPLNILPPNGAIVLTKLKTHRFSWHYFNEPLVVMPIGFKGSSEKSKTTLITEPSHRGTTKNALQIHPPWFSKAGTCFVEYRIKVPDIKPVTFSFSNAIRTHTDKEPPSDGVTFRVYEKETLLFEKHTDSKTWIDNQVDLSGYAGKEITLKLESHPGPKNNTTCDSSFWGDPIITSGQRSAPASQSDRINLRRVAADGIKSSAHSKKVLTFKLNDGYIAAVALGTKGMLDSAIALGKKTDAQSCVVFEGFDVSILGNKLNDQYSSVVFNKYDVSTLASGAQRITHNLSIDGRSFNLTADLHKDRTGLKISFNSPKRITDIALGPADQKAKRVYYGHGYCIENPQTFRAGFGGHNLSTSHVGFDFQKGLSLLTATDNPPDYLQVTPDNNIYALHTHLNATLTLVPSLNGAFDCAVRYQDIYDKKASPGFNNKAGRFVFDIWGGRYSEIALRMQKMIDYGLTDSLLTVHVWQRWGYDYRLPDIFPPNPQLGSIEDMQKIARVCDNNNIPWGLHDNYIDFYPDAEDYSYEHICFTENGHPIKAWINEGRNAQSYRWRPDKIMPFVKRNLDLIKTNLAPSHYFIDVFTSLPCFDYYDRDGNFHSMLETRRNWGQCFRWIQDYLGNAITTSEAGHDQLVGYLDGADCQHLTISQQGARFVNRLPCDDWQRVPWFDAVLHDKFSLHGVGYPSRYILTEHDYNANRLLSDDYISAEILTGHAMMIDRSGFGTGAVRKYWLAQDFIKSIATDKIKTVQFADDNIHRQIITWNSGAKVYVNRGKTDWNIAGKILPQYGYFAKNNSIQSSIERIDGVIVEQSTGADTAYYNARGFDLDERLSIRPQIEDLQMIDSRRFKMPVKWDVLSKLKKDLSVFVHFKNPNSQNDDGIVFQGDINSKTPMTKWNRSITTGSDRFIYIPANCLPGEYEIAIGIWDPKTGRRFKIIGEDTGSLSYKIGTITLHGKKGDISNISYTKNHITASQPSRRNPQQKKIQFGSVVTTGAFRCRHKNKSIVITPLPNITPFEIELIGVRANRISVINPKGEKIRNIKFKTQENTTIFKTTKTDFAYELTVLAGSKN